MGLTLGLGINGYFMSMPPDSTAFTYPFVIAGGLKIVYDVTIGCCFLWKKKQEKKVVEMEEVQSSDIVETPQPNVGVELVE